MTIFWFSSVLNRLIKRHLSDFLLAIPTEWFKVIWANWNCARWALKSGLWDSIHLCPPLGANQVISYVVLQTLLASCLLANLWLSEKGCSLKYESIRITYNIHLCFFSYPQNTNKFCTLWTKNSQMFNMERFSSPTLIVLVIFIYFSSTIMLRTSCKIVFLNHLLDNSHLQDQTKSVS